MAYFLCSFWIMCFAIEVLVSYGPDEEILFEHNEIEVIFLQENDLM